MIESEFSFEFAVQRLTFFRYYINVPSREDRKTLVWKDVHTHCQYICIAYIDVYIRIHTYIYA